LITEGKLAYDDLGYREVHVGKLSDLVQGAMHLLILKILAVRPLNCSTISKRLQKVSNNTLQVSEGSLYPALHKPEQAGWIKAEA
jgi:PadR family transcriptional regulator, regulatory protein PadR